MWSTSRRTALTAQECVSWRYMCVYGRNVNHEGNIYNSRIRQGSGVWHVMALRVASLLDRSARVRGVKGGKREKRRPPITGRTSDGAVC